MAETIDITSIATKVAAAIQSTDTMVVMSPDGDVNQTPIFQVVAEANSQNGCLCVQTAKLDIPTAEVLTLGTTPKPFGLTVPAGYYVQPLSINLSIDYNSAAYAANTGIGVRLVGGSELIASNATAIGATISRHIVLGFIAPPVGGNTQFAQATDYEVYAIGGDPTTGDSDIAVYMTYVLIPL
jgi:hypothetical protein